MPAPEPKIFASNNNSSQQNIYRTLFYEFSRGKEVKTYWFTRVKMAFGSESRMVFAVEKLAVCV